VSFGPQTKNVWAQILTDIDTPEELVHRKLTQVHTPRGSRIQFWSGLLALPREEFRISKVTLHSDLRRRAASRLALPCPSSFFVSPLVLRGPSTDGPETLPLGRNLAEFYNPTPKIRRRSPPPKKKGAKSMQNFGQFWTTSDFDREYLWNG